MVRRHRRKHQPGGLVARRRVPARRHRTRQKRPRRPLRAGDQWQGGAVLSKLCWRALGPHLQRHLHRRTGLHPQSRQPDLRPLRLRRLEQRPRHRCGLHRIQRPDDPILRHAGHHKHRAGNRRRRLADRHGLQFRRLDDAHARRSHVSSGPGELGAKVH